MSSETVKKSTLMTSLCSSDESKVDIAVVVCFAVQSGEILKRLNPHPQFVFKPSGKFFCFDHIGEKIIIVRFFHDFL